MKKQFLLILTVWLSGAFGQLSAQSSDLRTMDLYVMLAPATDTNAPTDQLQVGFKVDRADQVEEVIVRLDQGSTQEITIPVQPYQEGYALWYNNQAYPIQGYEATVLLPFSAEAYADLKQVSLHLRDKRGRTTQPLTLDL